MKQLTFLFACGFSLFLMHTTFAQNKEKQIRYANTEGIYISEIEFNENLKKGLYSKKIENDSVIVNWLIFKTFEGNLTKKEYDQIHIMLQKITEKELDSNKTIIIHHHKSNNELLMDDIKNKKYWNWVKRNNKRVASFLIGSKNSGIIAIPKKHLFIDLYDFFNNLFFKKSAFDYNHIYIKPDGSFKLFFGKFDILMILDFAM
jgi:hypothetical protein